uniref:Anoctamin n=1 Tax=Heterorhabditis bacteriophora TaxID=37862 RepID=A0A1I7XHY8_HETBA
MKVVVYKGYLSHQRKELESYWCPVMKRNYECYPAEDLHGTQKMWYYINKGILSSSIISCASEFFPVLLVTHWLACGGAEEKAGDIEKRKQLRQGVRGLLREFMKDISRVYASTQVVNAPPLKISSKTITFFWIVVPITAVLSTIKWLVAFYWTINFDHLAAIHWIIDDIVAIVANLWQVVLYTAILQSVELEYQRKDDFINVQDAVLATISYVAIQLYTDHPVATVSFGSSHPCYVRPRLSGDEEIHASCSGSFSETSLICMIFTQTIFPADYLFAFTISGCYLELLQRYLKMGFFQLGTPRLTSNGNHDLNNKNNCLWEGEDSKKCDRFASGPNIATIMHAAQIMQRKRMEKGEKEKDEVSHNTLYTGSIEKQF